MKYFTKPISVTGPSNILPSELHLYPLKHCSNIQIKECQACQEPEGSNAKHANIDSANNDKNEKDNNGKEKEVTTSDSEIFV